MLEVIDEINVQFEQIADVIDWFDYSVVVVVVVVDDSKMLMEFDHGHWFDLILVNPPIPNWLKEREKINWKFNEKQIQTTTLAIIKLLSAFLPILGIDLDVLVKNCPSTLSIFVINIIVINNNDDDRKIVIIINDDKRNVEQ